MEIWCLRLNSLVFYSTLVIDVVIVVASNGPMGSILPCRRRRYPHSAPRGRLQLSTEAPPAQLQSLRQRAHPRINGIAFTLQPPALGPQLPQRHREALDELILLELRLPILRPVLRQRRVDRDMHHVEVRIGESRICHTTTTTPTYQPKFALPFLSFPFLSPLLSSPLSFSPTGTPRKQGQARPLVKTYR